jgi:hypothetical protein
LFPVAASHNFVHHTVVISWWIAEESGSGSFHTILSQ